MSPRILVLLSLFLPTFTIAAESAPFAGPGKVIRLWEGDAPGALGQNPADVPTLTAYLPDPTRSNGSSILILPGGGYGALAPHEGAGYADWFVQQGTAAYVLKYRLGSANYRHPAMLNDVSRAL